MHFNPGSELLCMGRLTSLNTTSRVVTLLEYQLGHGVWVVALALNSGSVPAALSWASPPGAIAVHELNTKWQ